MNPEMELDVDIRVSCLTKGFKKIKIEDINIWAEEALQMMGKALLVYRLDLDKRSTCQDIYLRTPVMRLLSVSCE